MYRGFLKTYGGYLDFANFRRGHPDSVNHWRWKGIKILLAKIEKDPIPSIFFSKWSLKLCIMFFNGQVS